VSITPRLSLPVSGQLVMRPLTPVASRAITLIRRRHRSLSPVAERMWELIRHMAAQLPQAPRASLKDATPAP
jgi:hypothetical protein